MFDFEQNKQHQKVLCNENRSHPIKTMKKLAVRIKTLVQKAYSLNTRLQKYENGRNFIDDLNTTT